MAALKGVCIGAGYFSRFHYEAWSRIPEVEITALCDLDAARAADVAGAFRIPAVYTDVRALLDSERPDFVDIITPPSTHEAICQEAGARGVSIICQKPFAPTIEEAERIVALAATDGVRLMVHENFRFQPWHREIKKLLEEGVIGEKLHTLTFTSRMGDGWGPEAYLGRQPYFRTMPRLLVYETGVHFIDTFRFLAGEVRQVYAVLRRLNPVIAGEDCGLLVFTFESGAVGADILEDGANGLPGLMRTLLSTLLAHLKALDQQILELEREIVAWHRGNADSRRLERIGGIGSN